jgi:hypothetical protein
VRRPYFLEECLSHLRVTEQPFALKGKILRKEKANLAVFSVVTAETLFEAA